MEYNNGDFTAKATLHGTARVDGDISQNLRVDIPTISFVNVEISNKAPFFSAGIWDFPSTVGGKFAGFELTFDSIGMFDSGNGDPALRFNGYFHITESKIALNARGGFDIIGELTDDNGRQRWKYKNFKIDELHVNGGFPGVTSVYGSVIFFENDAVYGTGFRGELSAEFELLQSSIQVVGQFGRKTEGYKYFFIDALYCGDIPLVGPLSIQGLGGGIYHNMVRQNGGMGSLQVCTGGFQMPSQNGSSISKIIYVPEGNNIIGLKFTIAFGLVKAKRAFNGNASFEMSFFNGGGLNKVWIDGSARFMDDLDLQGSPVFPPANTAGIIAHVNMEIDFSDRKFTGLFNVYANILGVI
jgi:hypothetical protein